MLLLKLKTLFLIIFFLISCYQKPNFYNDKSFIICIEKECFEDLIERVIKDSKVSIDIAVYEFYNERITDLLIDAKKRGVRIRAVSDYDSENNSGWKILISHIPIVFGNSNGIMHNKYLIVDDRFVLTGSLNFTSDLGKNYNSIVLIDSKELAYIYKQDFENMFLYKNFSSNKDDNGCIDIGMRIEVDEKFISPFFTPYTTCYNVLNGGKILIDDPYTPYYDPQDYTNPIGYKILPLLNSATSSIKILAFSLTDKMVFYAIKQKALSGLKIDIYIDYSQFKSNYEYIYGYLTDIYNCGVNIKITFDYNRKLHHKVIIIDNKTILLGSMNFSKNGSQKNDENFIVIEDCDNFYSVFEREISRVDIFSYDFKYFQ